MNSVNFQKSGIQFLHDVGGSETKHLCALLPAGSRAKCCGKYLGAFLDPRSFYRCYSRLALAYWQRLVSLQLHMALEWVPI